MSSVSRHPFLVSDGLAGETEHGVSPHSMTRSSLSTLSADSDNLCEFNLFCNFRSVVCAHLIKGTEFCFPRFVLSFSIAVL